MANHADGVAQSTSPQVVVVHGVDTTGISVCHKSTTMQVSQRVQETDAPVIVATKALMATTTGVLSLAQGCGAGVAHHSPR